MPRSNHLKKVKRIVVKIGTSNITEDGVISQARIGSLVSDIITLIKSGYETVIVSSGAISAGAGALKKRRSNLTIPEKQAIASVGQTILMNEYRNCFHKEGYEVGQILMTEDDVKNRQRFLNARNTFNTLITLGVVPIVNENDSVAIEEIKIGDNDTLSAHVANIVESNILILLSDIDGFYWNISDPSPVEEILEINDEVLRRAGGSGSVHGTGGMFTKIKAAEMITRSGKMMIIANGRIENVLNRIMSGEKIGTIFTGKDNSLSGRKRWIEFNERTKGKIVIDDGAVRAIRELKKSLLASGIIKAEGRFNMGDAVEIFDEKKSLIGKGIINYSVNELQLIKGKKTSEIKVILDGTYFDEVINRDNLIILK